MSKRVKVHVGTFKDMGQRFVSAWHRLESGEKVRERHVTFPDLPSMLNALTPKRLELLRNVHREPASSVKALAERLGRDYKRVHEDVETLAASGLLEREDGRVGYFWDVRVLLTDGSGRHRSKCAPTSAVSLRATMTGHRGWLAVRS